MRNGDAYKIKHLSVSGESDEDICHRFRNRYDPEEVKRFIPGKPGPTPPPTRMTAPKKKRIRKAKAE